MDELEDLVQDEKLSMSIQEQELNGLKQQKTSIQSFIKSNPLYSTEVEKIAKEEEIKGYEDQRAFDFLNSKIDNEILQTFESKKEDELS